MIKHSTAKYNKGARCNTIYTTFTLYRGNMKFELRLRLLIAYAGQRDALHKLQAQLSNFSEEYMRDMRMSFTGVSRTTVSEGFYDNHSND